MANARVIKPKKKCCTSSPRCKRCPVVCRRLAHAGLAERRPDGRYELDPATRKKDIKRARKKRKRKLAKAA